MPPKKNPKKNPKKKEPQPITRTQTTQKFKDYDKTEVIKKKGDKEERIITFDVKNKKKFDTKKNLEGIYKRIQEKYKDRAYYIRLIDPTGTMHAGDHKQGLTYTDYEDYYKGKTKDDGKKFIGNVEKIIVTIV